jgi:hypothetical protein
MTHTPTRPPDNRCNYEITNPELRRNCTCKNEGPSPGQFVALSSINVATRCGAFLGRNVEMSDAITT